MSRPTPLSPLESAFLAIERARTPMHIGTVGIFEGGPLRDPDGRIRLDEIQRHLDHRLDAAPKLRCRVQSATLPGAPPVWVDHAGFDITRHVELVSLAAPGTRRQLWDRCGRVFSERLDRDQPLWHLVIVDGLSDGRVAVIERLHHAMADGLAGVEMAGVLFDTVPDAGRSTPLRLDGGTPRRAPAPPGVPAGIAQDLGRLGELGWRWAERGVRAARHPATTARDVAALGGALTAMARTGLVRPSSSLNRAIGSGRRVDVVRFPLDRLRRTAHTHGVTVNDLVLTAVGGGVGRLLRGRDGEPPSDLRVLVPVGLQPDDRHDLGNQVSAWMVRVPLVDTDPLERLRTVAGATGRARGHREELAVEAGLDLLAPAPRSAVELLGDLANHQPLFNLVVTNVPGPPVPLFFSGARLLEAYPFVPLAGNLTLGVAAMSYEGFLTLGLLADPLTCPDTTVAVAGIEADLDALSAPDR